LSSELKRYYDLIRLPDRLLWTSAYCLILQVPSATCVAGPSGSPQLIHPLSRHVAPDTPEELRAERRSYIPECWLPRSNSGSPSSDWSLRGYVQVHSRYDLPVCIAPLKETLSGRLDDSVTARHPAPCYGADRQLPRLALCSQLERRTLSWALIWPRQFWRSGTFLPRSS
jgi:hypothetical protein